MIRQLPIPKVNSPEQIELHDKITKLVLQHIPKRTMDPVLDREIEDCITQAYRLTREDQKHIVKTITDMHQLRIMRDLVEPYRGTL